MNISLLRNLVIIIGLSGAIYFVYGRYQDRQAEVARREAHNARIEKENQRREEARLNEVLAQAAKPPESAGEGQADPEKPQPAREKTQFEELAELRFGLKGGDRSKFPKGTQKLGDSWYLLVKEAMTWTQAQEFADQYGGRLAVFDSSGDLSELSSQISKVRAAWLGAGDAGGGKFRWVDGSSWQESANLEAANRMVAVSAGGSLVSKDSRRLLPFIIEWTEYSNPPGSVSEITSNFNPDADPMPVGTIIFEGKSYVILSGATNWDDARSKAEKMGATLAIPSTKKEGVFLAKLVNYKMLGRVPVWIGGKSDGTGWKWVSGEKGIDVKTVTAKPDHALAIEINNSKPVVVSYPAADRGSYFMVEWGGARGGATAASAVNGGAALAGSKAKPEQEASLLELREKARGMFVKIEKEKSEELKKNTKDLSFDLRVWFRGLNSGHQDQFGASYQKLAKRIKGFTVIPAKQPGLVLSEKAHSIYDNHLRKQNRLIAEYDKKLVELRDAYVKRLDSMKSDAEADSDADFAKRISEEASRVGGNVVEFSRYLKG